MSKEYEVKVSGIDEALEKANRLHELLMEAKTLADELTSVECTLEI